MNISGEIENLARHILLEAQKTGDGAPSFEEKTEALKTVTALYAILTKRRPKSDDDEEQGFADFARQIEEAEHGNGKTSVRNRRGADS